MSTSGIFSPTEVTRLVGGGDWVTPTVQVVGVGGGGKIITSADGISWTPTVSGTTSNLSNVIYAGGQYVAVGDSGTVLTSTNGISWTSRTSGTSSNLSSIAFSTGTQRYVATGSSNTIIVSTDGITWTSATSPAPSTTNISSIAFGNGVFVAGTSSDNNTTANILRSTDFGATWTGQYQTMSSTQYTKTVGVAYSPSLNHFAIVGDKFGIIYSANDGATWSNGGTFSTHWARWIAWVPGTSNRWVVAMYANYYSYSAQNSSTTNFTTSTSRTADNSNFNRFAWIPRLNLVFSAQEAGRYYTSTDGTSWTLRSSNDSTGVSAFAGPP